MGFLFWRKKKDKDAPKEQPVEAVEAPEVLPEPEVETPVEIFEAPLVEDEPEPEPEPEPVVEVADRASEYQIAAHNLSAHTLTVQSFEYRIGICLAQAAEKLGLATSEQSHASDARSSPSCSE